MKGQTQPVVLMLTATVLVGSISAVYIWGEPLLTKEEEFSEMQTLEQDVLDLSTQIENVARGGQGTTETVSLGDKISASNNFQITVNEQENYIEVSEVMENPPYPAESWTLIRGQTVRNLSIAERSGLETEPPQKSDDIPGAVAVKPRGTQKEALLSYRIEFRNLRSSTPTGKRLERIKINTKGQSAVKEPSTISITNIGDSWERGSDAVKVNNEKLERKNTELEINIR